jgi:hypothetical protein
MVVGDPLANAFQASFMKEKNYQLLAVTCQGTGRLRDIH